jgi:hypothetical protein
MQEEKNNNIYTTEYFRKYLDGQLSDQAMQAFEKAALEDPFLADAIEGFEESRKHAVSFESGIADLKTKLRERISQRKRKTGVLYPLSKWPVAASFLLVIGLAVFMVTYVNKKSVISRASSKTDSAIASNGKPVGKKSDRDDTMKIGSTAVAIAETPKRLKNSGVLNENHERQKSQKPASDNNAGNSNAIVSSKVLTDSIQEAGKSETIARKDITALPDIAPKKEITDNVNPGISVSGFGGPSGNYIKGMVIDDKGMPIPFAEVNLKGTNRHVFTDTAGFFKLYMKDPRLAALVFVQPSGYESVSAELKPDSNITNTIQLLPSSVVLNRATMLKYDKPSPISGWDAFYIYIDSNKKINTADSILKGEEVISFLLHPDGKLTSFKVEKSISPAHDAEILHLIQIAPALKLEQKKKRKCVLQIRFK